MQAMIRKISCLTDPVRGRTARSGFATLACAALLICGAQITTAAPEEGAAATNGHGAIRTPAVKKKVALTQFDVANTQHVDDIKNVYDGLPLALANRLETSGEFLAIYAGRPFPAETGEAQRTAITRMAGETGAQFLVSGMVVNAGTRQEKGYLGTSIGGYTKRHIEIELAVYDGIDGSRLLLRRLAEQAEGDVKIGNDKPFGSSIFFETALGQALNRLLDLAVADIRAALASEPFAANVVKVEGSKVFLDAGSDSLLKPGDKLVAYVMDAAPIAGLNGSVLGATDRAVDIVTLAHIQPQFAVGELSEDAAKHGIRAGSIVRIDPAEQRSLLAKQIAAQQAAKAEQEAREEAERIKAEQALQAEAARIKAEQDAKEEAARIKAEKKAAAQAKAQAIAEAKAAKLRARQEARAARIKALREARARAQAREKARAAAEARAAKLKARQEAEAEAARIKDEEEAREEAVALPVAGDETAKADPDAPVVEIEWSKPKAAPLKLKQIAP